MYAENTGQVEEFLIIIKKRKWQIILPAVFILALSIVLALIIPGKYLVEAKFELRHVRVEKDRDLRNVEATSTSQEVANAEDHLKSFERVQRVITDLKWDEFANLKDITLRKEYIKDQLENLYAVTPAEAKKRQSAFVEISYKHVDPQKGVQFIYELVNRWAKDLTDRDERLLRSERDGLQNEVDSSQRIFLEALNRKAKLEEEMGLAVLDPRASQQQSQTPDPVMTELSDVALKLTEIETDRAGISERLLYIRERLPLMEEYVNVDVESGGSNRDNKLAALRSQITQLRSGQAGLTPLHSTYRRYQKQIEALEDQLRQLQESPDEVIKQSKRVENEEKRNLEEEERLLLANLREVNGKIGNLTKRRQELEATISNRVRLAREHEETVNEVEINRDIYNQAIRELRIKEHALANLMRANQQPFVWTQMPFAPPDPTEPNPYLIIAIGLVGGLAVGFGSCVLVEFSKNCYRNVADVTAVMTLPILGVVNEIVTSQERKAVRWRRVVMVSSSAVMLTVIGWFTWAYTRKPEILPTTLLVQIEEFRSQFE